MSTVKTQPTEFVNAEQSSQTISSLLDRAKECCSTQPKRALKYAKQAITLIEDDGEIADRAESLRMLGKAYRSLGEFHKAREYYTMARECFAQFDMLKTYEIDSILISLNSIEHNVDGIQQGVELLATLENAGLPESPELIALKVRLNREVASLYSRVGEYIRSMEHNYAALHLCDNHPASSVLALSVVFSMGITFYLFHDAANSRRYYLQGLELSRRLGNVERESEALFHLARICLAIHDPSGALSYVRQARELAEQTFAPIRLGRCWLVEAQIHVTLGDYETAGRLLPEATRLLEPRSVYFAGEVLATAAAIELEQGEARKAIDTLEKLFVYVSKHNFTSKLIWMHDRLAQAYAKIGDHRKEAEHLRMNLELQEQALGAEQRHAVAGMEFESRINDLEQELKRSKRELHRLRKAIDGKDAAISKTTRAFADTYVPNAEYIPHHSDGQSDIEMPTEQNPWEKYAQEFEGVHGRFKSILIRQFPTLTPREIKVCYLLRGGLISKEIAQVLSVSNATVDVYRHRVRKKMELPGEVNLVSYLNSI